MSRIFTRQRLIGLAFLAAGAFGLLLCSGGSSPADRDGTGAVFVILLGLRLILSRKNILR